MRERVKRFLASLVAGTALSLALSVTASAEELETQEKMNSTTSQTVGEDTQQPESGEGNDVKKPDEAAADSDTEAAGDAAEASDTEAVGDAAEASDTEAVGDAAADSDTEAVGDSAEASDTEAAGDTDGVSDAVVTDSTVKVSDTAQTAEKPADYTNQEAEASGTQTTAPVVTVENGALTSGENWDADNMAGLRFDEASGSVVMVNNSDAVTIQTDGKGVNLSVAGVNRISTLYADGDVNITGTGIVLIDTIDLLEGTQLNLLTNTNIYTDGSAAVFLLNPETGCYELINGGVAGVLDEEYTIPDGITLVVPDGGTLDMRVTNTVTTTTTGAGDSQSETHYGFTEEEKQLLESGTEEEKKIFTQTGVQQGDSLVRKSVLFSTPKLNIAAESVLYIQSGGKMLMNSFRNEILGVANGSILEVSGSLYLDGDLHVYQGSSVGQAENFYLNVKNGGSVAGDGTLSGVTAVYETGAGNDDTLQIVGDGSFVQINDGGISSLTTTGNTGVVFDDGASIGSITATDSGSVTFYATDYTAQMEADSIEGACDISSGYVKVGQEIAKETVSAPTEGSIPFRSNGGVIGQKDTSVSHLSFWKDMSTLGQGQSFWKESTLSRTDAGAQIDFTFLSENASTVGFDTYEVFLYDAATGEITLQLLDQDSTFSLPAQNISMIRGVNFNSRITVGGETLNGSSNSGWTSGSTGSGWRYDGSSISMVNNGKAVDVKAEGKGTAFSVAGLNRIGTLYADGDVNITGTGMVLIESLDLKEGAKLNLLNIKDVYESGSAAVFLKNAKGEYVLINGSVVGILDEEYTIPSGITLVVPGTGVLDMRITGTTAGGYSAPKLTVSSGAALNMDGKLQMNAFRVGTVLNSSTLQIDGILRLNGALSVYRNGTEGEAENFTLNVMSGGSVTGTGTMTGVTAVYEAGAGRDDTLQIAGDGSFVRINNGGIASLSTTGKTGVVFGSGDTIGSTAAAGSGSITFYGVDFTDQMCVKNSVTGSYAIGSGYVALGTGFAGESFSSPVQGSIAFRSGKLGTKGEQITDDPRLSYWKNMGTQGQADDFWASKTYTYSTANAPAVTYSGLFADATMGGCDFYEVYVQEGDTIKLYLLNKDSAQSLSAANICQIRGVEFYSGLTVGNTVLDGATSAGWSSGSGWRYDGSSISMVNNGAAVDIRAEGRGADFSVAGLNRIGTLYADEDVNITGTGIVLIESLDLKEGAKLNLLTNTEIYQNGSAAVFLKNANGEYVLINGSVVGILDEEYTIPAGVKLVVPKDSKLEMRIVTQVGYYERDPETGYHVMKYRYEIVEDDLPTGSTANGSANSKFTLNASDPNYRTIAFKVPKLTIGNGATLTIDNGGQMRVQSFLEKITEKFHRGTLTVEGNLVLNGSISAFGANNCETRELIVELRNTGSVSGSGSLFFAGVKYQGGGSKTATLNFADSNNYVNLLGSGNLNIVANGQTDVYYNDGMSISSVTANSNVRFYVKRASTGDTKTVAAERLNIRDSLTGNYSVGSGYISVGGRHANESFSSTSRNENGTIPTKATQEGEADNNVFCTQNHSGTKREIPYCENGSTGSYNKWVDKYAINMGYFNDNPAKAFTFSTLQSQVGQYKLFEVFLYDSKTNCVTLRLVQANKTEWTAEDDPDQVFLVRGVDVYMTVLAEYPMGTGVNAGTSNTGSGILGGENAGSLTGGNASGIWNGDRQDETGGQSGSLAGTNTGSTGSGILGGGSSLAGGNASGIVDGDRVDQSAGKDNTLTGTNTGSTGSGILGSGSSLTGNNPVGVLSGSRKPPAPVVPETKPAASQQGMSRHDLILQVTGSGTIYDLSAFYDGIELKELGGGTVTVELEDQLDPTWNRDDIFAVFWDEQGRLVVARVRFNALTGKLEFDAPMLGQFQLVYLDWDGTDYLDEAFLAAIAALLK